MHLQQIGTQKETTVDLPSNQAKATIRNQQREMKLPIFAAAIAILSTGIRAQDDKCIVCSGGINVDGDTPTENGFTCGNIQSDAAQFDADDAICDRIKGFEELCCGGTTDTTVEPTEAAEATNETAVTDATAEVTTESPVVTTAAPDADTSCSVCPNGITVDADVPTEGKNDCGGIHAAAAGFDADEDICSRIKSFESTCCPDVPTTVSAIGTTETGSTAAAVAGSTAAAVSTGPDPTYAPVTAAADLVATNSPTITEFIEVATTNSPTNSDSGSGLTNAPTPKETAADLATTDAPTLLGPGPQTYAPTPKDTATGMGATDAPTEGNVDPSFATNAPTPGETSSVETNSPTPKTSPDISLISTTPTIMERLSCPDSLSDTIVIDSVSTLSYAIVPSSPIEANNGIFCGKLVSDSIGWIGLGISPDGLMSNSTAIIALPDDISVLKYSMGIERSVNPMSEDQQTLRDTSVTQKDGQTTMTFTKLLVEEGELPILDNSVNIFIHARGMSNTLGYHGPLNRLSFQLDFGGEDDDAQISLLPPSTNKIVTASPTLSPSTVAPTQASSIITPSPSSVSSNSTMPPTAVSSNNSTETDTPTSTIIFPFYEVPEESIPVRESASYSYALALEGSRSASGASLVFVSNVGYVLPLITLFVFNLVN